MHILADLQPIFNKTWRCTFQLNKGLTDHLSQEFEYTKLRSFIQGISVDDKGNIIFVQ